jgi:uncharacterized protein with beta-barrel porin domain
MRARQREITADVARIRCTRASVALLLASSVAFAAPTSALAAGGTGGDSNFGAAGGAGGTGPDGGAGQVGQTIFEGFNEGAGGGGGGAGSGATPGGTGGGGGDGGGLGGAGGTAADPNGQAGSPSNGQYGGGGGGGGYSAATVTNLSNSAVLTGGSGGAGGAQTNSNDDGGAGGGGEGGAGAVVTGAGASTNSGTLQGGAGGNGGNSAGAYGGGGGDGGIGVLFTSTGSVLTNSGTISGGQGGTGGSGYYPPDYPPGSNSVGGAGVVGAGLTVINSGTISGGLAGDGVTRANAITFTGGTNILELQAGYSFIGNVVDQTSSGTLRLGGATNSSFDVSAIGASAQFRGFSSFIKNGTSTWTLSGTTTRVTPWTINAGTLLLANVGALGSATGSTTVNSGGTLDLGGTTQTQAALNLNGGTLQNGLLNAPINSTGGTINNVGGTASLNVTSGTTVVSGTDSFTGGTTVTNATLTVNGSLSDPIIGSGGLLNGTGSVGNTTIQSSGTFAPGNGTAGSSMTVNGNLAFQSGALYVIAVSPTTASFVTVTGSATLGGATVNAMFASGVYVSKQYTILTATGGVSGAFASAIDSNLPSGFRTAFSYDAAHAYLELALSFVPPQGSNFGGNQQGVANAIVNFFNSNGDIRLIFGGLTPTGLTQISGETATGSQQTTFNAMGQFMGVMTDPFMNRGGGAGSAPGASGYADEASAYAANKKTDAFAMFIKAPPQTFEQRWSLWASGFGGSQSTSGNAAAGTNNTTSSVAGTAVGADYLFSPNTFAGFAMAGGGTNFLVTGGGSGRSDLFQFGAYVRHTEGPAYISAALAYGWQDITTNRTVTVAGLDQLRAQFDANAWSGRLEGGYRFVSPATFGIGITPYAAAQFVTFDLPAYAEQAIVGTNNFALAYGAKDPTDVRSELGIRTDKSYALADGILTLRGRFAWAHDYDPDRSIAATFQSLPGASFVVNGAAQAAGSTLTSASIEMKWRNGWSTAATFEGEFSSITSSYAGKGAVRYQW